MMCAAATRLPFNDVIDELVQCLALKEATRDDSDVSCAKLLSAKSLSSERKHNLPLSSERKHNRDQVWPPVALC